MSSERLEPAMRSWEAGDLDGAAALFREIAATGDPEASHLLACLLQDMGDLDGAEAAHRSVIQSDDPVFAQRSAIAMALMLVSACEWPAAHRVLSIAADGADFEVAALADTAMVLVCTELGDAAGAEAALSRARRCDSPAVAELAAQLELPDFAFLTAATAAELFEVAEDEEDYRQLLTCGDPEVVSQSAFRLYQLYAEEEEYDAARQVCEHAVAVGHPDHLAMAYKLLGAVLVNLGEYAEAADAYARAAEDPRPELRLPALLEQAKVHAQLGDEETTRAIFHRVIASGRREYAVQAHACLAQLHTEAGEVAQALTALRAVLEAGESPWSAPCVTLLALLLDQHPSSYEPAMELVRAAAAHPDPDTAVKAALLLDQDARRWPMADPVEEQALQDTDSGLERLRAGEVAEARRLLRRAVDSGAHAQSIRATVALAELEIGEGDREQADELLSYVAQGDDVAQGFTAAFLLHLLRTSGDVLHPVLRAIVDHRRLGRQEGLIRYRAAMDHDPAGSSGLAAAVFAQVLVAAGSDLSEAARLFESAVSSGDPLALSYTAVVSKELLLGHGRRDQAVELLRRARAEGHAVLAPWVAYELVELVGGDPAEAPAADAEARIAYGEAPDAAMPAAAVDLAEVLEERGDLEDARRALESGVSAGDLESLRHLLVHLVRHEQHEAVPGWAGRAVGSGDPETVAMGHWTWGEACRATGDLDGAVLRLREAMEAGYADAVPSIRGDLAQVLRERGDAAAAAEQAMLVMGADDPDAAARAALDLGCWLHEDGDLLGAADAFAAAVRAQPESEEAGTASANLAILAEQACERGEHPLAVRILSRLGADAADPARRLGGLCADPAAVCRYFELAGTDAYTELVDERGETAASLRTLRAAAAGGEPTALTVLAQALASDGQVAEARQVYEQVLEAGDADLAARAMVALGSTFHEEDGLRARVWYLKAVTAAEGHVAAVAAMHLGALAKGQRDFPEALGWYQRVIDAGDPEAAMAAAHLGELCYWLGDRDGTLRFYELTLNLTEQPHLVAEAACRLGEIRYEHGDLPAARRLLEQAVATGDDRYAAEAAALLTKL